MDGTHPSAPARVASTGATLSEHLAVHLVMISAHVAGLFPSTKDGAAPFLPEVLVIEKALSIQVHPDKVMAGRLHAAHPHVYKGAPRSPHLSL